MKKTNLFLALGLSLGVAGNLFAACDGSTLCETPVATTQNTLTINAASLLGIKSLNSTGPSGNLTSSNYWFAVSTADLGASVANGGLTNSGTGTRVVGVLPTHPTVVTPGSTVTSGRVDGTKGGTAYWLYAQACPAGVAANTGASNCSAWAKVNGSQVTTSNYPTTVFQAAPTKPADATINSISVRTTVPAGDVNYVSSLTNQEVEDLITPANSQAIAQITYLGNSAPYVIDDSFFTNGFKPNNKYRYQGQVQYPWDVVPVSGQQTVATFWTTPAQPGTVSVSNITHCSAQITALNSTGAPANPAYTVYNLCAVGTGGSCATDTVSGGSASDTASATVINLTAGATYDPRATALVGNGSDSTATGWNNSVISNNVADFTTLTWGGVFTVSAVGNTGATFNVSGITGAGSISSWSIRTGGGSGTILASGSGDPSGAHVVSGLSPNTVYGTLVIVLTEASGCASTLNFAPTTFTTTPFAPTAGSISATGPRALQASFTDASANPNGATTTYEVQVCLNAGFSSGCASTTGSKASGAAQTINIATGILPQTQYFAQVRARNQSRTTWPDSGWFDLGNVTTPNEAPVINTATCTPPTGSPSTSTCGGTVTDNGAIAELRCSWSMVSGAGVATFVPSTAQTATGSSMPATCPNVTATYSVDGPYVLRLTVTDANGSGLTDTQDVNITIGRTPTTITISGGSASIVTGGTTSDFVATVRDQFNAVMTGQAVDWTTTGTNSMAPANGATSKFTAGFVVGTFQINAAIGSVAATPVSINVLAAGPQIDSMNFAMATDNKGGTLTTTAHDNVAHSVHLVYTANDPSVTFAPNSTTGGDGVGQTTVVTFTKAGTFTLTANAGSGITSSIDVTVVQTLKGVNVTPNNITLNVFNNQVFTASGVDQFGNPMTLTSVSWSTSGGSVTGAGVFQSNTVGNNILVTATSAGVPGSARVNIVNYDVSSAYAYPVPYKSTSGVGVITFKNLGSEAKIRIYTAAGRKVFSVEVADPSETYLWNIKNNSGESLASGVYLYVIESPTTTKHGKLIIIQ